MTFSIVTATLNYGRFLPAAIRSVSGQGRADTEHVIIDGGSTDGTLDLLRSPQLPAHVRWVSEPDGGQSEAINKGFRMATGDVVAWLNADEYYLPGCFDAVEAAFQRHPDSDVVYGEQLFAGENGVPRRALVHHPFDWWVLLLYGCYIPSVATFLRRRILDAGELLDPGYRVTMDFEYYLRLHARGYRIRFVPEVLGAFRWHAHNVSAAQAPLRHRERIRAQRRYGPAWARWPAAVSEPLLDAGKLVARMRRLWLKRPGRRGGRRDLRLWPGGGLPPGM